MKKIYSLDRGWKFIREQELIENTIDDYFDMFSNNTKTGTAGGPGGEGCYDGLWREVNLPHDYHAEVIPSEEKYGAEGHRKGETVWYRRHFTLAPGEAEKRVFIKFDAIAITSEIYVNSVNVFKSSSGSTPIFVEITDFIEEGRQITVAVKASNTVKEGWWYEGVGIFGHTYLIVTEEERIVHDGVFAVPECVGDSWKLKISAELETEGENSEIIFEVPELGLKKIVTAENKTECVFEGITPELWHPDCPKLYMVEVTFVKNGEMIDKETVEIGFRTCVFDSENGFFINGEGMKLKGVCLHNDHAGVGVAIPEGVMEYRLKKLKSMGVNAVRTSHNPYLPEFYRYCDRMGIMVMNEIRHFSSTGEVTEQLKAFIKRDRNHPSVIMWSMFNEEPLQCSKRGEKIAWRMKRLINEYDGSRPVSGGMNGPLESEGVVKVVDIMGFNYLQYGYDNFHKIHSEIPVIGSETGSYMTTRGTVKTDKDTRKLCCYGRVINENLHAWSDTPGGTWKNIEERDFVMGGFYWTGFDYRGECGMFPSNVSSFGAMDLCGFPKDNYFWHRVLWVSEPQVYISPCWNSAEEKREVICYSNCDYIKLYINGDLVTEFSNNKFDPRPVTLPFIPGTLTAEGYTGGKKLAENSVFTHGCTENLKSEIFVGENAIVVDYYAKDGSGNFVTDADNLIKFEVTGGIIAGVGNGDNSSLESDKGSERKLYNGCCQLIVTPISDKITVRAYSEGISECVNEIESIKVGSYPEIPAENGKIPVSSWRMSDNLILYPEECNIANLMFAWIPTTVGYGCNYIFSNNSGFGIIAGTFSAPGTDKETYLVFEEIKGAVDIYFGKELLLSKDKGVHKNTEIKIPKALEGESVVVTVVFKMDSTDCGIPGNVYIRD